MAATIQNTKPAHHLATQDDPASSQGPAQEPIEAQAEEQQPASKTLSCLQQLPASGLWAPEERGVWVAKSVRAYVCTHGGACPPADQNIQTDNTTEAWIRLLKRRGPAAGSGAGPSTGSKATASAKRPAQQPAGGKEDAAPQKKTKLNTSLASVAGADTALTAKQAPNGTAAAAGSKGGSSKKAAQQDGTAPAGGASTSKATPAAGTPAAGQGGGSGGATRSPYFQAPPPAAAALAAAVQGQGAAKAMFEQDQLKKMPVKELKDVCKARSLQVSGTKDQLITRIVEYQRRLKRAQQPA